VAKMDLYQLLQMRNNGGSVSARRVKTGGGGFLDTVKGLLPRRARGGGGRRSGARRGTAHSLAVGGPALAAVVFGCLAVGFVLGRALAPAPGEGDLSVVDPRGASPGAQGVSADGAWTPEKEEEKLSDRALVLVTFPPSERHLAADLAEQLRGKGVPNARILKVEEGSRAFWLTVVYTGADPDPRLLNRLRTMREPTQKFQKTRQSSPNWPPLYQL